MMYYQNIPKQDTTQNGSSNTICKEAKARRPPNETQSKRGSNEPKTKIEPKYQSERPETTYQKVAETWRNSVFFFIVFSGLSPDFIRVCLLIAGSFAPEVSCYFDGDNVKPLDLGFSISALYVFGDSTVDAGNNNHLTNSRKADKFPYGIDFNSTPMATGRFTNGKTVADYIGKR
ncbi:hypothetical protein U1Q18_041655 [Sarracenia purpurea var. burkii]